MDIHERLSEIQKGINKARDQKAAHQEDIASHKDGTMPENRALFHKPEDSNRLIAVNDRYIDYWTHKYHQLLLDIPAHKLAVSIIRRFVEDAPDAKMQAEEYMKTFSA